VAQHAGDDSTQAAAARRGRNCQIPLGDAVSRRCARLSQSLPLAAPGGWYHEAMVRLTERAAEHVLALMREDPEALALRVAVQGGGCSGLQYALGFDGEPQAGDEVVDQHGVKVVVDRFSLPYLSGAEVDFVDGLMGQGFTVNNPNAVASCGCGSSFKADGDEDVAAAPGCNTCSA
jgi:iron-sulfur cluster assembly accessory protein